MKRAMTVVELLVVIAIILVLAGLILPIVVVSRKRAKEPVDASNMHQLYLAFSLYEEDSNGPPELLTLLEPVVRSEGVFEAPGDGIRKPYSDGTWPGRPLIPCDSARSKFKISYAYLRNFGPYRENDALWAEVRQKSEVGLFASPWNGSPTSRTRTRLWCGELVEDTLGTPMTGPVLRINMDGSAFRLPRNKHEGAIGNVGDLFLRR